MIIRFRSWYRQLPKRKQRGLRWMLAGAVLLTIGVLGLLGIIPHPKF